MWKRVKGQGSRIMVFLLAFSFRLSALSLQFIVHKGISCKIDAVFIHAGQDICKEIIPQEISSHLLSGEDFFEETVMGISDLRHKV